MWIIFITFKFSQYIYIYLLIFNKLTELLKQTYLPKLGFAGLQHGKKYERDRFHWHLCLGRNVEWSDLE